MIPGAVGARGHRGLAATVVALALQVSVLPFVAWHGVVPNLVLLVVVAAAISCGSEFAMVLGFGAGLLLDLAPPADHVAGRWALALVVVGLLAGYVRTRAPGRASAPPPASCWPPPSSAPRSSRCPAWCCATPRSASASSSAPCCSRMVGDLLLAPLVPGAGAAPAAPLPARAGLRVRARTGRRAPARRPPRSRLRLVVVQALVLALFATLVARLYYVQVVDGDAYHARAASQSVRDVVVQPQRGLVVDDQGRPLVANRMSWVVSVDLSTLDKLPDEPTAPRCSTGSARGHQGPGASASR